MSWTEIMHLKNEFHIAATDTPVLKSFNININILGTTAKNVGTFKSSKNGSVRIKFKVQSMVTGTVQTIKYYAILSKNGEEVDRGTLFELTSANKNDIPQFLFVDFNVKKNVEYEISIVADKADSDYISFQNCSVCGVLMLEGVVE